MAELVCRKHNEVHRLMCMSCEKEKASPPPDLGAQLEATADIIIETVLEMDRIPEKADTVQIMEILQAFIARNFGTKPDLGAMLVELAERDGFEKGRQFWFMQDGMLVYVHSTNECKPNEPLDAVTKALES